MKRFFTKKSVALILLFLVLGGFFVFHNVQAQSTNAGSTVAADTATSTGPDYNMYSTSNSVTDSVSGALTATAAFTVAGVLKIIETILSFLLAFAGFIFDKAINFSIFNIKSLFDNAGTLNIIWTTIRDAINILFIFILLYISITKIIGSWGVSSPTTLVNIIIDVILINFSMFFTKIIIDAGNLVAVALYNQIQSISAGDISATIVGHLNLTNAIVGVELLKTVVSSTLQTNMIITLVLQIALISILAWVFFYGSFLFIGRTVMLMFLAISSPIGFVFGSIPWIKEHTKLWWKTLTDQILVAPIFLFFLLIVIKLMQNNNLADLAKLNTTSGTPPVLDVSGWFFYIIVIVLLLKGMELTQKLSGKVGEIAVNVGKVAAVAGAVALTGGAAAGMAAFGAEGAAAETTGMAAGKSALRSRLEFAGQQFGSNVGKVFTGEHTGVAGAVSNIAKSNILGGVKGATGGFVDIDKLQKEMKKGQEENEKRVEKAVEKAGPGKDIERKNEIENMKKTLQKQAETKIELESGVKAPTDKVVKDASKELSDKTQARDTAKTNWEAKAKGTEAEKEAKKAYDSAESDFAKSEKTVSDYKKYEEKRTAEMKTMATNMGTSLDAIDTESKELAKTIVEKTQAQQNFIGNISKQSFLSTGLVSKEMSNLFGGLVGSNKDKVINKLRAGKQKDLVKAFQTLMKENKIKSEEEESEPATPKATAAPSSNTPPGQK
jgi:hypothetical protein